MEPWFVGGAAGSMGVLVMVPALMVGFDVIPQSAEEIDLPFELIGKLLIASVVMAVCWYVLISIGVALALDPTALAGSRMATADATALVWGGAWAGKLLVVGGSGGNPVQLECLHHRRQPGALCARALRHAAAGLCASTPEVPHAVRWRVADRRTVVCIPAVRSHDSRVADRRRGVSQS